MAKSKSIPMKPGYYWAKWRIATDETHDGGEMTPSDSWEIVEVNGNHLTWEDNPADDEALSVSVPGVRETQWRDQFVWGEFVAPLGIGTSPLRGVLHEVRNSLHAHNRPDHPLPNGERIRLLNLIDKVLA